MPLTFTVTTAGRAALVNADNTGTAPVTIAQVGLSQTVVAPLPADTVLAGEFKRIAGVAGEVVADDTIHINMTDESADAYTLHSIALYLADGTLFALHGHADPLLEKTALSIAALSVDMIFTDIDATLITFGNANFTNPPATTERQGVVELSTLAEAQAGIDALLALTPAVAKAAILGWLLVQDGAGSGLDADLLDGLNSDRFVYGDNSSKTVDISNGDINSARSSGFFNGNPVTNAPTTGWWHYLNLRHSSLSNHYAAQLALNFQSNDFRFRAIVNNIAQAWAKLWHDQNDGAGSGLDADLLDGQDGAYYTNILARLGWTPVQQNGGIGHDGSNKVYVGWNNANARLKATVDATDLGNFVFDSQFTAAAILAKLLTVDGSGSGLDADLLKGLTPDQVVTLARVVTALGYTPVNKAGDTMTGLLTLSGAPTANLHAATKLYVDGLVTAAALLAKIITVDGAGSGLDADTVDGLQGADLVNLTGAQSVTGQKTFASPILNTPFFDGAQVPTVAGAAPLYMARAKVNFDATGTITIREAGNVSSITDNGVGDYTANFTTPMPTANYVAQITSSSPSNANTQNAIYETVPPSTTGLRFRTGYMNGSTHTALDRAYTNLVVF